MTDPSFLATAAASAAAPAIVAASGRRATEEYWTWLAATLRNRNTRRAYRQAAETFLAFCAARGAERLADLTPMLVAAWVETLDRERSAGTAKLRLSAVRALCAFLARRGALAANPAAEVRGPRRTARAAATPALSRTEARALLDAPDPATLVGRRDRALLAVMLFALARVGAVAALRVRDVERRDGQTWLRLGEKRGLVHAVPLHREADQRLRAYLESAGIAGDRDGALFRAAAGRTGRLGDRALAPRNIHHLVRRRAADAGVAREIGCHALRATGVTLMLGAGVRLEVAQRLAGHASPETTRLYDRRADAELLEGIDRAWL